MQTFKELELKPEIIKAITAKGYEKPMPIQAKAIPVALTGKDLIGCAQTGTGKTAAFMLPVLHMLKVEKDCPRVVVLAPTRELAIQIGDNAIEYSEHLPFTCATVYGGVDIEPQIRALRKGVDVLVATPGRLLDLMRRRHVSLKSVQFFILDEADRMLDMGFIPDVEQIMRDTPKSRQTMLFSATMPPEVRRLANKFMKDVVHVNVAPPATMASGITHRIYPVPHSLKKQLLVGLLRDEPVDSALIFTRTRRSADNLVRYLDRKRVSVTHIHSDRTQNQRQQALKGFRSGKFKVLVATDIAARGLDIPSVSHVFNYNIPDRIDDYVHRAGRTARAEGTGYACCLMAPEEIDLYNALESRFGREMLNWTSLEGFDYLNEPSEPADKRRPAGNGGGGGQRGRRGGVGGRYAQAVSRSTPSRTSSASGAVAVSAEAAVPDVKPAPRAFGRGRTVRTRRG